MDNAFYTEAEKSAALQIVPGYRGGVVFQFSGRGFPVVDLSSHIVGGILVRLGPSRSPCLVHLAFK
jgi:hypothetical protein